MTHTHSQEQTARRSPTLISQDKLKTTVFYATLLLFYYDAFSGVIKWGFHAVGLTFLSYIPMALVIGIVLLSLAVNQLRTKYDARLFAFAAFFMLFAMYALLMGRSPYGVAFSLYTWAPFFLGMLVVRYDVYPRLLPHIFILLLLSICGVVLSSQISVPWVADQDFTVAGIQVSSSRNWHANGVNREPGFSRASFTVANDIVLFTMWMWTTRKPLLLKVCVWLASLYAVILTTSKTPLIIVTVGPPMVLLYQLLSRLSAKSRDVLRLYSYITLLGLMAAVIAPPYLDLHESANRDLPFADVLPFMRMDSFVDRMDNMWPRAFKLLEEGHAVIQSIFGRGLGGIGLGQFFSEMNVYNSADNLHIFLYVTFGVFCCLFWGLLVFGSRVAFDGGRIPSVVYFGTLIGVLGLGTLTVVVEATIPVVAFGILISSCLAPPLATRAKRRQLSCASRGTNREASGVVLSQLYPNMISKGSGA